MTKKKLSKFEKEELYSKRKSLLADSDYRDFIDYASNDKGRIALKVQKEPEDEMETQRIDISEKEAHKITDKKVYWEHDWRNPYIYSSYSVGKKWNEFRKYLDKLSDFVEQLKKLDIEILNMRDVSQAKSCLTREMNKRKKESEKVQEAKNKKISDDKELKKEIEDTLEGLEYLNSVYEFSDSDYLIILAAKSLALELKKEKGL